jgi:hypothetical protein
VGGGGVISLTCSSESSMWWHVCYSFLILTWLQNLIWHFPDWGKAAFCTLGKYYNSYVFPTKLTLVALVGMQ